MKLYEMIFLISLILYPASSLAVNTINKDIFSITLPDEWVELPKNVLIEMENTLTRQFPKLQIPHHDYVFQLKNAKRYYEYPYIIIQVNNKGRMPESELYKMENYSPQRQIEKIEKGSGSMLSNIQLGKMYYDATAGIVWFKGESTVSGVGQIAGVSGLVLTENGSIQVVGWALKDNFQVYEPVFQQAILSVTPIQYLKYRPNSNVNLPLEKNNTTPSLNSRSKGIINWDKAILSGIASGILIAIIMLFKRKNK
jgi:hypothetical protein